MKRRSTLVWDETNSKKCDCSESARSFVSLDIAPCSMTGRNSSSGWPRCPRAVASEPQQKPNGAHGDDDLTGGAVSTKPNLRAALDYAARGWLVVPLHSPTEKGCS